MPLRVDAVAAVSQPAPVADAQTRFYGAVESPVTIVLDGSGGRGSFVADAPLDSFRPPLSREALAGLSIRIGVPPNQAPPVLATVIQKGGRWYLHLALESAEVNALKGSPLTVAVGDAASLTGLVMAPKFVLQVNAGELTVDLTQPVLAAEREGRATQAKFLSSLEGEKAGMVNGTSRWFGGRQLEQEHERLTGELTRNTAALAPRLAALETALAAGPNFEAVLTLPSELGAEHDALHAANSAALMLNNQVIQLEERRRAFTAVPSELPAIDAELVPLKARAAASAADVHAQLAALYTRTRAEQPAVADSWLQRYATTFRKPGADELVSLLTTRRGLTMSLSINDADLARLRTQLSEGAPRVIERLTVAIAAAAQKLGELDAKIAGLRDGTLTRVETFATTYPPDKPFI